MPAMFNHSLAVGLALTSRPGIAKLARSPPWLF